MSEELSRYALAAQEARALSGRVRESAARTPMTVRLGPQERQALAFLAQQLDLDPGTAMREAMVREARAAGWSAEPGG